MLSSQVIETEAQLDDALSEPPPAVVEALGRLDGDLIVLGVAGKMGPSLARMARRASDAAGARRRVIGVARFSAGGRDALHAAGVETVAVVRNWLLIASDAEISFESAVPLVACSIAFVSAARSLVNSWRTSSRVLIITTE